MSAATKFLLIFADVPSLRKKSYLISFACKLPPENELMFANIIVLISLYDDFFLKTSIVAIVASRRLIAMHSSSFNVIVIHEVFAVVIQNNILCCINFQLKPPWRS